MSPDPEIRAGGGIVWRRTKKGNLKVLLVHRPRYDDWSFPKGKAESGEDYLACARREVEEETGLVCAVGPEVGSIEYLDRFGRDKRVRYWAMEPVSGEFVPNDEVDQLRWVRADRAATVLTYPHDAAVLESFCQVVD